MRPNRSNKRHISLKAIKSNLPVCNGILMNN